MKQSNVKMYWCGAPLTGESVVQWAIDLGWDSTGMMARDSSIDEAIGFLAQQGFVVKDYNDPEGLPVPEKP